MPRSRRADSKAAGSSGEPPPERLVEVADRQLARDDRRAQPRPVLDHLQHVGRLGGREGSEEEVIDLGAVAVVLATR